MTFRDDRLDIVALPATASAYLQWSLRRGGPLSQPVAVDIVGGTCWTLAPPGIGARLGDMESGGLFTDTRAQASGIQPVPSDALEQFALCLVRMCQQGFVCTIEDPLRRASDRYEGVIPSAAHVAGDRVYYILEGDCSQPAVVDTMRAAIAHGLNILVSSTDPRGGGVAPTAYRHSVFAVLVVAYDLESMVVWERASTNRLREAMRATLTNLPAEHRPLPH